MSNTSRTTRRHILGRRGAAIATLLALAVVIIMTTPIRLYPSSIIAWASSGSTGSRMIYTVTGLQRQAARTLSNWDGRVVWVRGTLLLLRARIDPFTWRTNLILVDSAPDRANRLPVLVGESNPVWALLRQLPLAARFVPRAQTVHLDTDAIYYVQLHALYGNACDPCYEAVLLDAVA